MRHEHCSLELRIFSMATMAMLFLAMAIAVPPSVNAAEMSVDALLQGPRIQSAAISPDGRYVSLVSVIKGQSVVAVYDRHTQAPAKVVLTESRDGKMRPTWCAWGNETRLVCGYRGLQWWYAVRDYVFSVTRLVAVDADGGNLLILMNRGIGTGGLVQDRVIDWTPDDPRGVLIQFQETA